MQCAFEWTSSGTKREYLVDTVKMYLQPIGEEHALGDATLDIDVRLCALVVEIPETIFEELTGNPRNANQIWKDLIRSEAIDFYPDATKATSFTIVPDIGHRHKLLGVKRGALDEHRTVRFKGETLYDPDDVFLDNFDEYLTIESY